MTTDEIRARTERGIDLADIPAFIDEMLDALGTRTRERDIAVNLRRSTTASALGFAKERDEARAHVKTLREALTRAIRALEFADAPESRVYHFRDLVAELQTTFDATKEVG